MIERTLFREEHRIFRESVRRFVERKIVPFHAQWERDGAVPRELWREAGAEGLLCCTVPEQYGGLGLDYLFDVVVYEVRGSTRCFHSPLTTTGEVQGDLTRCSARRDRRWRWRCAPSWRASWLRSASTAAPGNAVA